MKRMNRQIKRFCLNKRASYCVQLNAWVTSIAIVFISLFVNKWGKGCKNCHSITFICFIFNLNFSCKLWHRHRGSTKNTCGQMINLETESEIIRKAAAAQLPGVKYWPKWKFCSTFSACDKLMSSFCRS